MSKSIHLIFIALGFVFQAQLCYPNDDRLNLREVCRKRIAGKYLTLIDEMKRGERLARSSSQMLTRIQRRLAAKNRSARILKSKIDGKEFNSKIFNSYQNLKKEIKTLKHASIQEQDALKKNLRSAKTKAKELKEVEKRINRVFHIKKGKKNTPGYNIHIHYLKKCPKFRINCPLSKTHAHALQEIYPKDMPEECQRYLSKTK